MFQDSEVLLWFLQTALNQTIPMLRSSHLQPGINLNPISFPSADLTLKVNDLQFHVAIDVTDTELCFSFYATFVLL